MPLDAMLKDDIKRAIDVALSTDIQEIVARETRRALREHEDELTVLIRTVVASAIAEMLA